MSAILTAIPGISHAKIPKVVVIGGGIAGLTAAYRLTNAGMDVDLYEARNRVGGRIFTAHVNGHIAELGGQNFSDGGSAVHLNRLIDEFGLQRTCSRVYLRQSYFNGKELIPVDDLLKNRITDPEALQQDLQRLTSTKNNMKEILEEIIEPSDPLYKVMATRLATYEGAPVDKLAPVYIDTLYYSLLGGICSAHQASGEADIYVEMITIKEGNSSLPKKIAEKLGSRLHLNMPLVKVAKSESGTYLLTFNNGEEVKADLLVLAMPCSVYGDISFEESVISSDRLKAICSVQYGQNAKIMVPLDALPTSATGVIGDEIVSFIDDTQKMMTVYYCGKDSLFSSHTIADTYLRARPMIEMGFDNCPAYAAPAYAKDKANQSYEGAIGYSWPNDPYAKGTYSYIGVGQEKLLTSTVEDGDEIFKALFAPIESKLYFAGEHTSILFDVPGTMEAACESGERIAKSILSKIPS